MANDRSRSQLSVNIHAIERNCQLVIKCGVYAPRQVDVFEAPILASRRVIERLGECREDGSTGHSEQMMMPQSAFAHVCHPMKLLSVDA